MGEDELRDRLLPSETLLWWDRPAQGLAFTGNDLYLVPFSLLWGGFAIFWESSVIHTNAPFFFRLWGIPFVLVGLYLIFGRFFIDAWLRTHVFYGLTDLRVLILQKGPFARFTSFVLDSLPPVSLTERADGRGTIAFELPQAYPRNRGFGTWIPASIRVPQFFRIPDARRVYNKIQELTAKKAPAGAFKNDQ